MNAEESNDIASLVEAAATKSHELGELISALKLALHKHQMQDSGRRIGEKEPNIESAEGERQCSVALLGLANRLPSLERSTAEVELAGLTVSDIRKLAGVLQIRIPSKIKKIEAVNMLLEQVFDLPAGQQLIRTFHKRNSQPNHSSEES